MSANTMTTVAAVAAVALAVGPEVYAQLRKFRVSLPERSRETPAPTYSSAIESLAAVRTRLAKTDCLGEAEKKAVDTITLALVQGSDK